MDLGLEGRNCIVTGASRGIGLEAARQLCAEGASVLLVARSEQALGEAAARCMRAGGRAEAFPCDVTEADAGERMTRAAAERLGPVDVLVNSAGTARWRDLDGVPDEDWQAAWDVNVIACLRSMRAVVPGMRERGAGRIVNIASELGLVGEAELSPYCASKAGVIGLTKALARELAPARVRVNCVAPGPTDTSILRDTERTPEYLATIPLGRLGTPAEIAWAVWYLASPHAEWITGQVLSPNGGVVM
jgi:3-oxoacyl-[acyl-carrier protein] reductase